MYDAIASAIFLEPGLIQRQRSERIDVDTDDGLDFGRTLGYAGYPGDAGPAGSGAIHVVKRIDVARFFDLYVSEFTRPVGR